MEEMGLSNEQIKVLKEHLTLLSLFACHIFSYLFQVVMALKTRSICYLHTHSIFKLPPFALSYFKTRVSRLPSSGFMFYRKNYSKVSKKLPGVSLDKIFSISSM